MSEIDIVEKRKTVDRDILKRLVPLGELSPDSFNSLAKTINIEHLSAEKVLFKIGKTDKTRFYLLSGLLALESQVGDATLIRGGSEESNFSLDHHQPHQRSAVSKTSITFIRIDDEQVDSFLTLDQSKSYVVDELSDLQVDHDCDDWMVRILSCKSFQLIPPANLQAMFLRLEPVTVRAKESIIRQGEKGDYYYIISRGRCIVTTKSAKLGTTIRLAELGSGESFGEEALISETRRNASVTMKTDGVLMRLSRADFEKLIKEPVVKSVNFEQASAMLKKGAKWLDVRLASEFQNENIKGAINIPLGLLRAKVSELNSATQYIVYCATGKRSSVGTYILNERGFEAYTLEGGLIVQDFANK